MFKSKFSKVLVSFLALIIVISSISPVFAATTFKDVSGNWAEKELKEWSQKGWISGYADGSLRPGVAVTRTEYMALINRAFGFQDQENVSFKDIISSDWQYPIIAAAVKAGYVKGYSDETIHPNDQVSREAAAVMLARILQLSADSALETVKYNDTKQIAEWSLSAVTALVGNHLLTGYEDNTFRPEKSITRAEAVVMLDRALKVRTITYSKAGTFGPETGSEAIQGNVAIDVPGVTIKNMVIEGNLLFATGIGSGDATLKNVTVRGKTTVNGGGSNSIHLEDSTLESITVNKKDGSVRIVAEGSTAVKEVNVESSATIEQSNVTNGGFASIYLSELLPEDSKIKLTGSFENVNVTANQISLELSNGTIGKLNVDDKAKGSTINMDKTSVVKDLVLNADIKATGEGKIDKATVNEQAKNSTIDVKTGSMDRKGAGDVKTTSPTPTPAPSNGFNPGPVGGNTGNSGPSTGNTENSDENKIIVNIVSAVALSSDIVEVKLSSSLTSVDKTLLTVRDAANNFIAITSVDLAAYDDAKKTVLIKLLNTTTGGSTYSVKTDTSSATFIGILDSLQPEIVKAVANSNNKLEIEFNKPIHFEGAVFSIKERYGSQSKVLVVKAAFKGNKSIILDTADQLETLYEVSITGVKDFAQQTLSAEHSSATFVGYPTPIVQEPIPDGTLIGAYVKVLHSNKIYIKSGSIPYDPTKLSSAIVSLQQVYGAKSIISGTIRAATSEEAFEYGDIGSLDRGIVFSYSGSLENTLYQLKISSFVDIKGNNNYFSVTFIGENPDEPIQTSIMSSVKLLSEGRIYLDLSIAYDATKLGSANVSVGNLTVKSVSAATRQDTLDFGYSDSTVQEGMKKGIVITVNKDLIIGSSYRVSVSSLMDKTGDLLTTSSNFFGNISLGLPKLQGVIALDNQTLEIYFDRDVTSSTMNIWNDNSLVAGALTYERAFGGTTSSIPLTGFAYQDYLNKNALIVRTATNDAFKVGSFVLSGSTSLFYVDNTLLTFNQKEAEPVAIVAENVMALNSNTLRVYFNQPVYGTLSSFARIKATIDSGASFITLSNPTPIDSSNQVYEFKTSAPFTSSMTSLTLEVALNPSPTVISDDSRAVGFVGYVAAKDESTGIAGIAQTRPFSSNTNAGEDLKSLGVFASDNKTIRVFYPTQMNHDGITGDYTTSVLNPANYRFVNGDSTPVDLIDTSGIAQIKYNSDEHSVTITLTRTLSPSLYNPTYLLFANTNVRNGTGTQFVRNGSAPIKIPFVMNSTASAKVTVTNATYTNGVITIELSQLAKSQSNQSNAFNGNQLVSVFKIALKELVNNVITELILQGSDISSVYANNDGSLVTDTSTAFFDTLIITLTPATQAALASGQTGKININQSSFMGINGNYLDVDSSVIFGLN